MGRTTVNGVDIGGGVGTPIFDKAVASTAAWTEDSVFNFTTYVRYVLFIQGLVLATDNQPLRIAGRASGAGIGANVDRFCSSMATNNAITSVGASGETNSALLPSNLDNVASVHGSIEFFGVNPPIAAHVKLDARLATAGLFIKSLGGGNTFRVAIDGFSITSGSGNISVARAKLVGYTS